MLRGAKIYGEIAGWAMAHDASHPVAFRADGANIAAAITDRAGADE